MLAEKECLERTYAETDVMLREKLCCERDYAGRNG